MELLKAIFASTLAVVMMGGLYIASVLVGYFTAVITAVLIIVGMLSVFAYIIYELIGHIFGSKKKKKALF